MRTHDVYLSSSYTVKGLVPELGDLALDGTIQGFDFATDVVGEEKVIQGIPIDLQKLTIQLHVVTVHADWLGAGIHFRANAHIPDLILVSTIQSIVELFLESDGQISAFVALCFGICDVVGESFMADVSRIHELLRECVIGG